MPSTTDQPERILFNASLFIGALLAGDPRHDEARPLVEAARRGEIRGCTTAGILSEVYAALTWEKTQPCQDPTEAAETVRLLVEAPSAIEVLDVGYNAALRLLGLAAAHGLSARRIHDARHAAAALFAGVRMVYTYDPDDWREFEVDGLQIAGPESTFAKLVRTPSSP